MPARSRGVALEADRGRPAAASSSSSSSRVRVRGRGPREGRDRVAELQRARLLGVAARVIAEHGYERMSVSRVTCEAHVSRRTFYDLFEDRHACFVAVIEDALGRACERVLAAYGEAYETDGRDWCARVRAGLEALLRFFDEEPASASLLVVDALGAGPVVLARRGEVLARVARVLQEDGERARGAGGEALSELAGEGVVGGVLAVLHTRLSARRPGRVLGLLSPLMAMIVLPYLGAVAARREAARPVPGAVSRRGARAANGSRGSRGRGAPVAGSDPLSGVPMRLTYRTARVLEAAAQHPGVSNRVLGELAGTRDQGQISKLLARLERLGLLRNAVTGLARGERNEWVLTPLGERVARQLRLNARSREGAA